MLKYINVWIYKTICALFAHEITQEAAAGSFFSMQ